ncbi:MAG: enolase C-terminal domain-like protein [Acidobacteriota bacterium]
MRPLNRRAFIGSSLIPAFAQMLTAAHRKPHGPAGRPPDGGLPSDVAIKDVSFEFEDFLYRTPYQFGGRTVDQVTLLNVRVHVETRSGKKATGFGSMPLGNAWSFLSSRVSFDDSLDAMKRLAARLRRVTAEYDQKAHPIDINWDLEPLYMAEAETLSKEMELAEPIPRLCTLVTASPFDAAIHDAFGKANGINCYHAYGPEFLRRDLSHYLGSEFKGEFLDRYVLRHPAPFLFLYHSVGASDPIFPSDIRQRIGDGLPETLGEWIEADGLTHLKIKLNGADLEADVERVVQIERASVEAQQRRGIKEWKYCCDFNERCKDVHYVMSFLSKVKERSPEVLRRLQYIEQPTARDLKAHPDNTMFQAAKVVPIVADESLVDTETFHLARRQGYTGVALKACKGQTHSLLNAALAQKYRTFVCVQDLTCPGASFLHSAGLACHVPGVQTIEGNGRQYVPAANEAWRNRFPTMFVIRDGRLGTSVLTGQGLGVTG